MNLTVLSSGPGWHVQDLHRAAKRLDMELTLSAFHNLAASEPSSATAKIDAFLIRTMPPGSLEQIVFRMDALHAAVGRGIRVFNPPRALETCIDKYLTTHRLAAAGLPVPRTWAGQTAEQALQAFGELGGDVVIKPLFGSEGRGMVRVCDSEVAWRTCHAIEQIGGVIYLQEFVQHPGWDLRAFVLGDRVLAAMRRHASGGWRTNISQQGRAEAVRLNEGEVNLALAAACAVGCPIAGVDLIQGPEGWLVLEVNAVPGWRALAKSCGVDVAIALLDYLRGEARK